MSESRSIVKIVSKPWGFEKIITNTDKYCGKFLYIVKGNNTSMHYHKTKHETFYVHGGKVKVIYSDDMDLANNSRPTQYIIGTMQSITLNSGDNFSVPSKRIHQIFAIEDTALYEFSTVHNNGDTVYI